MNACPKYSEAIALLAAQSLDPVSREQLERHLASCPDCRSHLEGLQRICRAVEQTSQDAPSIQVPNGFHQTLVQRVRQDAAASESRSLFSQVRQWFSWTGLGYATATAAILVIGLIWLNSLTPRPHLQGKSPKTPPIAPSAPTTPAPTLMALSRALQDSDLALDSLMARQEQMLAANDPPSSGLARNRAQGVW